MKKNYARMLVALVVLLAGVATASAQDVLGAQETRNALSTFPESQGVLYVNIRRTIDEALPRLMSPADVQKHLAEAQKVGVNLHDFEYLIVGVRLADALPSATAIPDFVVLLKGKGTFSPDALLTLARVAADSQGMKMTQETYNSRTLNLVTLNKEPAPGDTNKSKKFPVNEIAATTLDSGTLVIGTPSYVRSTIDAASGSGQGRLNAAFIDLAARNTTALSSLTVVIPPEISNYLKGMGIPQNEEANRIVGWLKQVSISNGMSAQDFNVQAAIETDSAEHANAINGMIGMGVTAAQGHLAEEVQKHNNPKDAEETQAALSAIKSFTNTVQGSVVILGTSVPQATLAAIVKKNMYPPPPPQPITATKNTTRHTTRGHRRTTRKH